MKIEGATQLARILMDAYGLHHWTFAIMRRCRNLRGRCDDGLRTIFLTKGFVRKCGANVIIDTILHEISHALTPGEAHGAAWRKKCLEIGATPLARRKI